MADDRARIPSVGTVKHAVRVLSVPKPGILLAVRFLGGIHGTVTHWHNDASYACRGTDCPKTIHAKKSVWKGYAAVMQWSDTATDAWIPYVLEVTDRMHETLSDFYLRGQSWIFKRVEGPDKRQEINCLFDSEIEADTLPLEFNVRAVVQRLYGVLDLQWDVPPILPAQVKVEGMVGPGPAILIHEQERTGSTADAPQAKPATKEQWEEFRRKIKSQ